MRMRRNRMKMYSLRKRIAEKNREGGYEISYAPAEPIEAIIWQASGHVQATMYGEKLQYIKNMEYAGNAELQENDGICVEVSGDCEPDYKITSIRKDVSPMQIVLERI